MLDLNSPDPFEMAEAVNRHTPVRRVVFHLPEPFVQALHQEALRQNLSPDEVVVQAFSAWLVMRSRPAMIPDAAVTGWQAPPFSPEIKRAIERLSWRFAPSMTSVSPLVVSKGWDDAIKHSSWLAAVGQACPQLHRLLVSGLLDVKAQELAVLDAMRPEAQTLAFWNVLNQGSLSPLPDRQKPSAG